MVEAEQPVVGEVLQRLRVIVVAGVSTGVVVVGLGSRLAMFVLRLTSPHGVRGVTSDDGFTIGRFTLSGTYNLLLLGAVVGIIGAGAYRAVAPWLLGPSWFRRVTVASGAGAVVGAMLIHTDGIDFNLLKPTWLAVGLFIALPAAFGAAVGVMVDRVAPRESWTARGRRRWVLPVVLLACFPLSIVVAAVAGAAVMVSVLVGRFFAERSGVPTALSIAVRGGWLAVAVAGLVALVDDVVTLV